MRKVYFLSISSTKPVTETIGRFDKGKELMPWFHPGHACIGWRRCTVCGDYCHFWASCTMLRQPYCVWFVMVGGGNKDYKISSNMDLSISYNRKIGFSKMINQVFQKKPEKVGTLVEVKSFRSPHWMIHLWLVKW